MTSDSNLVEATVPISAKIAGAVTQGGAATAIVGGYTVNEWAMFGGLVVSVLGLIIGSAINWHWKKKAHELAVENSAFDRRQYEQAVAFERRHRIRRTVDTADTADTDT
jgi:hypothetical protein